jgi:glycosyltransferase involved in cell wall biosynthesis
MIVGFRLRLTIVLQHEPDDDLVTGVRGSKRAARLAEERLRALMWRGATEIWFHSEFELDCFSQRYAGAARQATMRLVTHGEGFTPEVAMSQAEAREQLGVPADERMFLCVGFLSAHKGVDRVLRAFSTVAPTRSRLWIVGSAMRADEGTRRHVEDLHSMAAQVQNVEMYERHVDDAEFDTWLRAADFVVLAYRSAASSSVLPRAQLLGARVIASGVGGMSEQMRPGVDIVAPDDDALLRALREACQGA